MRPVTKALLAAGAVLVFAVPALVLWTRSGDDESSERFEVPASDRPEDLGACVTPPGDDSLELADLAGLDWSRVSGFDFTVTKRRAGVAWYRAAPVGEVVLVGGPHPNPLLAPANLALAIPVAQVSGDVSLLVGYVPPSAGDAGRTMVVAAAVRSDGTVAFVGNCGFRNLTVPFRQIVESLSSGRTPEEHLIDLVHSRGEVHELVRRRAIEPPRPEWANRPPHQRSLYDNDVPPELQARIVTTIAVLALPTDWLNDGDTLCFRSSSALGLCARWPYLGALSIAFVEGEPMEIFVERGQGSTKASTVLATVGAVHLRSDSATSALILTPASDGGLEVRPVVKGRVLANITE